MQGGIRARNKKGVVVRCYVSTFQADTRWGGENVKFRSAAASADIMGTDAYV